MTLVIDATVALAACGIENGFDELKDRDLLAPPLMWSEAYSVLHELWWRGEVETDDAERTRARLDGAGVAARNPRRLRPEAWRIAGELGWAKTYDAEYLALGRLSGCRVVTLDRRLRRGAERLGLVVTPDEL
jgi:predicted nucleic acid-binding protein